MIGLHRAVILNIKLLLDIEVYCGGVSQPLGGGREQNVAMMSLTVALSFVVVLLTSASYSEELTLINVPLNSFMLQALAYS